MKLTVHHCPTKWRKIQAMNQKSERALLFTFFKIQWGAQCPDALCLYYELV